MTALLAQIVERRRLRVANEGPELGEHIPTSRRHPVVPFVTAAPLVCEVKRRSPSRGDIDTRLNPVDLAATYQRHGATAISVLTEQDHFSGSLADLLAVKRSSPALPVLRKDFLFTPADVDVAYRAGADAVLLLASTLTPDEMAAMLNRAKERGLAALVEVHTDEEIAAVRPLRPELVGVNCRDLQTFDVDLSLPARLAPSIDWPATLLFESGIHNAEDTALAQSSGYAGVLVGEAVVRNPELVGEIAAQLQRGVAPFWRQVLGGSQRARGGSPGTSDSTARSSRTLVKICGLTTPRDAEHAMSAGADVLGFMFTESPRRATAATVRAVRDLEVPKVGVVVDDAAEAGELLAEGALDALQLHGDEAPDRCFSLGFPYYKALPIGDASAAAVAHQAQQYRCPRVLVDHGGGAYRGGSGKRVADEALAVLAAARGEKPLWLAGGLAADNVAGVIHRWRPELVDASTRLESAPGKKDPGAVSAFLAAVRDASAEKVEVGRG